MLCARGSPCWRLRSPSRVCLLVCGGGPGSWGVCLIGCVSGSAFEAVGQLFYVGLQRASSGCKALGSGPSLLKRLVLVPVRATRGGSDWFVTSIYQAMTPLQKEER